VPAVDRNRIAAWSRPGFYGVSLALMTACASAPPPPPPETAEGAAVVKKEPTAEDARSAALPSTAFPHLDEALSRGVTVEGLQKDVTTLASDAFLGRAPGGKGEEQTLAYLSASFGAYKLEPGGDDGSYLAKVPLIGAYGAAEGAFRGGSKQLKASAPNDFVAHTRTAKPDVSIDADLVFVGYGIEAPEFGWDDFKGVDVKGKLLVMLVGDPPVADASSPEKLDDKVFGGRAMTYYGRWTYKYEIAAKKGAAGVLLIHEAGPAGYDYEVVKAGAMKEQLMLADDQAPHTDIEGWLSEPFARNLLKASGQDFDKLKKAALDRNAKPVALKAHAMVRVRSKVRKFNSHNVIGVLKGRDEQKKEAVVVTAHWDHLGYNDEKGDRIYNGAIDNASGVASLLAVMRTLAILPDKPRRSVVFVATTAEESGLLGAKHYASSPYIPLSETVANVNMDCMNLWGPARGIISVGQGASSLDAWLDAEAKRAGRVVLADPEPEKGYFFRSDHLELMRKGVPALHFLHPGAEYEGLSSEESAALRAAYVKENYHKVSDEAGPKLRYEGAVADAQLLTRVIVDVTESDATPTWNPGAAFSR
jgi:Zn-dependent M28 family amino/carboxypeptidase